MLARNYGRILQVSSIGAYQPSPTYAVYSAAKSFVLYFGEAINYELRKSNVRCTVISPGVTATEFLKVAGQKPSLYQRLTMMQSPAVTWIGIDKMLQGRSSVVPGFLNSVLALSTRLIPYQTSAMFAYRFMTIP